MPGKRNIILFFGFLFFAVAVIFGIKYFFSPAERTHMDDDLTNTSLQLVSPVFKNGAAIPPQYTCKGQNVSPPLNILGVTVKTKSLALIMHDPDAVSSDYTHWLVWDMPASTEAIAANSLPVGALQGANGQGKSSYTGPCPPAGTGMHHYQFELYALDKTLGLPVGSSRLDLEKAMSGHIVDHYILVGTFSGD